LETHQPLQKTCKPEENTKKEYRLGSPPNVIHRNEDDLGDIISIFRTLLFLIDQANIHESPFSRDHG